MKHFGSWLSAGLAIIAFLLPWQARWIYDEILIDGAHTEFGVMSLYAIEVLIFGLGCIVAIAALRRVAGVSVRSEYRHVIAASAVALIIAITASSFVHYPAFSLSMCVHLAAAFVFFGLCVLECVRLPRVLAGFVAGMLVPTFVGLAQVFGGASPASTWLGMAARDASQLGDAVFTVDGQRVLRAYGTFPHPNVFGGYLGVALFAWWHLVARMRGVWSHEKYVGIGAFGTIFLLGALVATGSRSAMLGVVVGLLVMMTFRFIQSPRLAKIAAGSVGSLAIGGSLVASFMFVDVVADLRGGGVNEERSLTERVALYKDFLHVADVMNPLTGDGVGAYVLSAAEVTPGKSVFDYQPVHNAWALMAIEMGFLGTIAVSYWLLGILRVHLSRLPHPAALSALGMMAVLFSISMFDHYLWSSASGLLLIGLVGAVVIRFGEGKTHS